MKPLRRTFLLCLNPKRVLSKGMPESRSGGSTKPYWRLHGTVYQARCRASTWYKQAESSPNTSKVTGVDQRICKQTHWKLNRIDRINRRKAQGMGHNGFRLDGFDRFLGGVKWRAQISLLVFLLSIQLRFPCKDGEVRGSFKSPASTSSRVWRFLAPVGSEGPIAQAGALAKSWAYLTSHAKPRRGDGRSLVSEDIVLHFQSGGVHHPCGVLGRGE
jgi:hypothetical protein